MMTVSGIGSTPSTFELDEKAENLTSAVDDGVSTQISLKLAIEERSITRKILDVVIKVVLAPFKLVLTVFEVIQSA